MTTRLLFVDDDSMILDSIKTTLRGSPYEVLLSNSAEAALKILAETPIDILITDEEMPVMKGTQLLTYIRKHYPQTIRIMLSGHLDTHTSIRAVNQGRVFNLLEKPTSATTLKSAIKSAIEERERHEEAFASLRGEPKPPTTTTAGSTLPSQLIALMNSAAWITMDATTAGALTSFYGVPFEVASETVPQASSANLSATISLAASDQAVEMEIEVRSDVASMRYLTEQIVGPDEPLDELLADMQCEAANVLMGEVKTVFDRHGYVLTGGLPSYSESGTSTGFLSSSLLTRRADFCTEGGATIQVSVRAFATSPVEVAASQLCEGMILANDLYTPAGVLMLRTGTRLTQSYIRRIVDLGPGLLIDVTIPRTSAQMLAS